MPVYVGPNSPSPGTDFEAKSDRVGIPNRSSDPSPASAGDVYYNTSDNKLKFHNGTEFADLGSGSAVDATGGTKNTSSRSGYNVHTFTGPGTLTIDSGTGDVEYLVIAGGAGGGTQHGGGGGAGGYRSGTINVSPGNYPITVGAGGAGSPNGGSFSRPNGTNGSNSTFGPVVATGGGGGSSIDSPVVAGSPGGSGGGAALSGDGGGAVGAGLAVVSPDGISPTTQGNNGGAYPGYTSAQYGGGSGGGGAGGVGGIKEPHPTSTLKAGTGGNGQASSITGSSVTRAGGGGGGSHSPFAIGPGGPGGGGDGGLGNNTAGSNGTAALGGGGGGGGGAPVDGGAGGAGVVIIAYPTS